MRPDLALERPDWLTDRRALAVIVAFLIVAAPVVAQVTTQWTADPAVTLDTQSGLDVTIGTQTDFSKQNVWNDTNTLDLPGGTISATGPASVTVDDPALDEPWTNLSSIDATQTAITVNADGKRPITIAGDTTDFDLRTVQFGPDHDGTVDFVYNGSTGHTNVTLQGATPETNIAAVDHDTGTELDVALSDADGTVHLNLSNSEHAVDVQTRPTPPYVQTAQPINNVYEDSRTVTLNATVDDPRGEQITATIYWEDGTGTWQQVAQQTVAPGTHVTTTIAAKPGINRWNVSLESADGRSGTSPTFRFRTAGTISVYNASSGSLLTDRQVTAGIASTEGNYQDAATTNDGVVDLLGAPNERLRVELSASGYANGTLIVDDVGTNQTAVLYPTDPAIPDSDDTYVQAFALDDLTGAFPQENTSLEVRTYVNGDWRVVGSDIFGPLNRAEIPVTNQTDYRLRVRSDAGDVKSLGLFTADKPRLENATLELTIQELDPIPPDGELYTWDATVERPDNAAPYINFAFGLREGTTVSDFDLWIYEYQNESNTLYQSGFGVVSSVSHRQPLTEAQSRQVWVVRWNATLDSGQEIGGQEIIGSQPIDWPVDPRWGGTFVMLFITIVMSMYGGRLASLGTVIALALSAIAMYFQIIEIHWAFWWVALIIALGGYLRAVDRREVPV